VVELEFFLLIFLLELQSMRKADVDIKHYILTKLWIYAVRDAAGSLLEQMAHAVEQAAVVILCFTERYKNSPNCRTGL